MGESSCPVAAQRPSAQPATLERDPRARTGPASRGAAGCSSGSGAAVHHTARMSRSGMAGRVHVTAEVGGRRHRPRYDRRRVHASQGPETYLTPARPSRRPCSLRLGICCGRIHRVQVPTPPGCVGLAPRVEAPRLPAAPGKWVSPRGSPTPTREAADQPQASPPVARFVLRRGSSGVAPPAG